jgi:hypothetical protein
VSIAEIEKGTELQSYAEAPGAIEAATRAEVDVQIATAKRFPRSPERFLREACTMVAVSPEIAAQCRYRLPARKGGDGKPIEGASVRLAEIAAACWGNLRIMGRIVGDDGRMITAQGVALDLERNLAYSVEVQRGVVTSGGRRYGDDMVRTTCLAAISIATRNATFKVIPRAFVSIVEDKAQAVARGDEKTLPERLAGALKWFGNRGVQEAEVMKTLGVAGRADVTLDHLVTLQEYRTAIHEGHTTVEDVFRPAPAPVAGVERAPGESKAAALARAMAGDAAPKVETTAAELPRTREPGED